MGRFLVSLMVVSVLIGAATLGRKPLVPPIPNPAPIPTLAPTLAPPGNTIDIQINERTFRVAWITISDPSALSLIPNFTEKRTAQSLIDGRECQQVINGGFYTKDYQPTGLFISEGNVIRTSIPNTLLNGYLSVDRASAASIRSTPPDTEVRLALQTGPILIQNSTPLRLAIREDEFARRSVGAVTQKGMVMFLSIYESENAWSGPKLADVPTILAKLVSHARLDLRDAINLDGGSASAFIRPDLSLGELTAVGSFFCIR
ncbi:phosphodiester glycosidase family protein [Candidatus Gottesmanbacteria bacterium]|nr:phosphodiester glycosidase family protein [Candidatus Gottesmanbacteria bacterium]